MKSPEDGGVVDGKLNVYGVQGLKVAGMPPECFASQTLIARRSVHCSQNGRSEYLLDGIDGW